MGEKMTAKERFELARMRSAEKQAQIRAKGEAQRQAQADKRAQIVADHQEAQAAIDERLHADMAAGKDTIRKTWADFAAENRARKNKA